MPRTTLDIDAGVLRELRRRQRRERKTLGQLVSELLAAALAAGGPDPPPAFEWATSDLRPRIDLDDTEAVYSALEEQ